MIDILFNILIEKMSVINVTGTGFFLIFHDCSVFYTNCGSITHFTLTERSELGIFGIAGCNLSHKLIFWNF